MRVRVQNDELSLHLIAGTHTVLIAIDVPECKTVGLLGFASHRVDDATKKQKWLQGFRSFKETEAQESGEIKSLDTCKHPIQAFLWGDYTVVPKSKYTYTVTAVYGDTTNLDMRS